MNKAEKIKAEIERLKKSLPWGSCASQLSMECNCKNEAYNEVLSYIDTLEKEPVSNDLEEAARKTGQKYFPDEYNIWARPNYEAKKVEYAFKEGAQWQKEKLSKAVKLADAMYYAAQQLTTDASHLSKAMKDWWNFKNVELNKGE